jgi:hypothetical protein
VLCQNTSAYAATLAEHSEETPPGGAMTQLFCGSEAAEEGVLGVGGGPARLVQRRPRPRHVGADRGPVG